MSARLAEKEGFAALLLRMRADGIDNRALLAAVEQTPRSLFAPTAHADVAWSQRLVPIDCGAFMEGVDLAVRMIHLLGLAPGQRVLEVGTGSGFTGAVMARLAERVLTVDRYETLVSLARQRYDHLGLRNAVVRKADASTGMSGEGTFDRILATVAFPSMPRTFAEQLATGGVMITAMERDGDMPMLVRLTKTGSRFEREDLFPVPFQPPVEKTALVL